MAFDVKRPKLFDLDTEIQGLKDLMLELIASEWITPAVQVDGSVKLDFVPDQIVEASLAQGSAVALTTGTPLTVCSVSLPAGNWELDGVVVYDPTGAVNIDYMAQGASSTNNTLPVTPGHYTQSYVKAVVAQMPSNAIARRRLVLTSTTTVYLVAQSAFSGGTSLAAFGWIRATKRP